MGPCFSNQDLGIKKGTWKPCDRTHGGFNWVNLLRKTIIWSGYFLRKLRLCVGVFIGRQACNHSKFEWKGISQCLPCIAWNPHDWLLLCIWKIWQAKNLFDFLVHISISTLRRKKSLRTKVSLCFSNSTAPCGLRTKWPLGRHTPLYWQSW